MSGWLRLLADLAVLYWWGRVMLAVIRRPATRWDSRWLGKSVTLLVGVTVFAVWSGVLLPWGAVLVWWRVLVRRRDPFELPMADGRPMP